MSGVEENPEASIPESSDVTKEEASDPAAAAAEEREAEPPTVDDVIAQEQEDVAEKKESDNNIDKEVINPKQGEEDNPTEEEVKPKEEDEEAKKSEMTSPEEPAAATVVAADTEVAATVVAAAAAAKVAELSPPEKKDDNADEIKTEEKADEIKTEEKAEEIKIEDKTEKMEIEEPKIEEKSDVTKPDEKVEDGIIEESPPADKIEEEKVEKVVEESAATTDTPEKKDEEMKEEATTTTTASEKKEEENNNEERTNEDVIPEKKDEEPTPVAPTPNVHPTPEVPPPAEIGKDQETASSGPEGDDDTSKAEDQSLGNAQNEEGERTDDAMDTEDQNTNRTDPAEEQSTSSKGDLPYSTRGRSTGNDTASANENWERGSALETLEEIGRAKESTGPPPLGTSFLEALSEEQRRTRTRFLPEVEGMHILRKTEVKDDLALARSLVLASGVTSLKKSKAKKSNSEDDAMDVDEEGGSPSEDDRSSDIATRSSVIEFRARDLVLPSGAFRAPKGTKGVSNEDGIEEREDRGGSKGNLQSPSVVESVTAFNPPRPPESIGAKKKHRMLRWERRPEDVEIDLNNYHKTVQRTRQELHSAEAEFNRMQTIDAHLRWHYLSHLNLMNEEYLRLNDEFSSVQQECVKAADLLTSRTRSRGAGKGSYVMRDVLTVLKTRGAETKDKESMNVDTSRVSLVDPVNSGVGGLASLSFKDWSRSTAIEPMPPASSWIVEGENVKTPYGDGVVLSVHPAVDYTKFSGKPNQKSVEEEEKSSESAPGKGSDAASKGSKRKKDGSKPNVQDDESKIPCSILPARVSVKMKYGTGHFTLDAITPIDNPAVFSDAKLASRWKSMVNSALSVSGCLDVQGMTSIVQKASKENPESESSDMEDGEQQGRAGASQEDSEMVDATDMNASGVGVKQSEDRPLPFGSSMLPTSSGRGNSLQNLPIVDVEEGTNQALFQGKGVLGETTYQGVTDDFRKWEDDESEYVTLQASVLQLRNALVRQKRIRMLNEKTSVATSDRYRRAEELVSEMRSDLKSLKQRLEQELNELGIDEATAEQILSSYYEDNEASRGDDDEEEEDAMESSPSKRRREEGEGAVSQYGVEDADRESYHGPGTDGDFSRDDLDSRPTKKIRANQ